MTSISEISATGGAGGDEHNIKQPSSIGGDEQHDDGGYLMLSDLEDYKRIIDSDTDPSIPRNIPLKEKTGTQWNASTCGDEQQDVAAVSDHFSNIPTYNLNDLDDHINRFDTDPKILDELDKRVKSDKETQTIWFHELRNTWTNPKTPEDAFEHVLGVFYALYNGLPPLSEFQGFLKHYGLPTYGDLNLNFEMEDAAVCDGVSDSTAGDIPTYNLEVLSDHIKRYDTEPEVLHELDNRVSEDTEGQTFWFQGLRKAWTNPKTPEDASRLVRDVFYKLYNGCPPAFDLQGFLEHYGLPTYWELPEGRKLGFYSQRK